MIRHALGLPFNAARRENRLECVSSLIPARYFGEPKVPAAIPRSNTNVVYLDSRYNLPTMTGLARALLAISCSSAGYFIVRLVFVKASDPILNIE